MTSALTSVVLSPLLSQKEEAHFWASFATVMIEKKRRRKKKKNKGKNFSNLRSLRGVINSLSQLRTLSFLPVSSRRNPAFQSQDTIVSRFVPFSHLLHSLLLLLPCLLFLSFFFFFPPLFPSSEPLYSLSSARLMKFDGDRPCNYLADTAGCLPLNSLTEFRTIIRKKGDALRLRFQFYFFICQRSLVSRRHLARCTCVFIWRTGRFFFVSFVLNISQSLAMLFVNFIDSFVNFFRHFAVYVLS